MNRSPGTTRRMPFITLAVMAATLLFASEARATGCPGGSQTLSCTAYWGADGGLRVSFSNPATVGVNIAAFWEPGDTDVLEGTVIRLAPNSTIILMLGTPPGGVIAYKIELSDGAGTVLYCLHAPLPPTSFTESAARSGATRGRNKFFDPQSFSRSAVLGVKGAAQFDRGGGDRTMSGTLLNRQAASTSWLLYPDACTDIQNGSWSPRSSRVADSLNSYSTGTTGPYQRLDLSIEETLWHVVDAGVPAAQRPAILSGTRSLWCGMYDPVWPVPVGYPNSNSGYQILYIDTGPHGADYTLNVLYSFSCEPVYDHLYLIGGGGGNVDPIGNSRPLLDEVVATGQSGSSQLLVSWTGSIRNTTPGATSIYTLGGPAEIVGAGAGPPDAAVPTTIRVAAEHRALYLVFRSDEDGSSEDGLWPQGHGLVVDNVSTSDNGVIYGDQVSAGGIDAFGGSVILGSPSSPVVSARVPAGVGELWQIANGSTLPTPDWCSLQKNSASDRMFFGVDAASHKTIPGQSNAFVTCPIPVPVGAAALTAMWDQYVDLPQGSGMAGNVQYSCFKDGAWSNWINVFEGGGLALGNSRAWSTAGAELTEATQADFVQLRFALTCVRALATDGVNCGQADYGILYDNLRLEAVTGVPAPTVDAFPGSLPQTTFVDGTMTGLNCSIVPCWPGIRGSDLPSTTEEPAKAIRDNFNSPLGDSITVAVVSALRRNGMGVNWRRGYDKSVDGGLTIARTNGAYNLAYDTPRMVYRLFDPTSLTWSPLDSTELDADAVSVSGADTVVIGNAFRVDWPPRDKAGTNLPGGFTINGVGAYNSLPFLPRGSRMEYTFKAVDINGGVRYANFSPNIEELEPITPGQPIIKGLLWCVLPGVYPSGSAGSLLAGRTNTPILNLDGAYSAWSDAYDPVTAGLRGMGVRADRYRFLQGLATGGNIGGHELTGLPDYQRPRIQSNYFPNMDEYGVKDSLAKWYRIIVQSSHGRTVTLDDEQDARLLEDWWATDTGNNGGDRCIFASGDNYFSALLSPPPAEVSTRRVSYGQNVFGVAYATDSWNGTGSTLYPTVEDRFANPGSGPALVSGYTYPVDGGCPRPNRFDALTKIGPSTAQAAAFYPLFGGTVDVAAVAMNSERDAISDNDRNKALGYGLSILYPRKVGIPTSSSNYAHSGVQERMQVLYKFLASCRGPRSGSAADTAKCWPCPTDANMMGNWAALSGFQTAQYGPLYPIQDNQTATGVEEQAPGNAPLVNSLLQNRPNPFNPETTIPYSLASAGRVQIRVFDVSGRVVRTLVSGVKPAGLHSVRWNGGTDEGGRVASGIYFYRITYPDGSVSAKKLAMLR